MNRAVLPPLLWLNAEAVADAMPPLPERLELAKRTMTALARPGAAELPPKIAIHPRPPTSWVHAMPAHLRGDGPSDDLVGMKWVGGYATNNERGLPALNALVVVNEPDTGVPVAIVDGGPITAQRTAAISGVAIELFAPEVEGRSQRVTLIGAGVQGRSHLPVLGRVLPGLDLAVFDRHPDRAEALAEQARATDGIASARVAETAREAVRDADVVVTAASFTRPEARQVMTNDWLTAHALVVPVDYATYCAAEVARDAALFVVDHREQFIANREVGNFADYPEPAMTLGEALLTGTPRPEGRVVVTHLGVGLADLVFANAILERASAAGMGLKLPR